MDRLPPAKRSWLMSRIKAKNTAPELIVRRLIFGMGYRYRIHSNKLPGHPDLAFPGRKKVIFVNGCFWHGHEGCRYGSLPKTNTEFWETKISRNKKRDIENIALLDLMGWKVLTVWQCQTKDRTKLEVILKNFLNEQTSNQN